MSEPHDTPSTSSANSTRQRYWLRGGDPTWGFKWRGLLPLAALIGLVLYAVTGFAARTEERVTRQVRQALLEHGYAWAQTHARGQAIRLSGSAPNQAAAEHAEALAREVRCQTWVGALPCVTEVNVAFTFVEPTTPDPVASEPVASEQTPDVAEAVPPPLVHEVLPELADAAATSEAELAASAELLEGATPATSAALAEDARWYALRAVRTSKALRLTGEVPSKEMKSLLMKAAKAVVPNTLAVKSALTETEGSVSPGWQAAAQRLIDVMGKCNNGRADISSRKLEVNCEVADKAARDELQSLSQQPLDELEVGRLNLLVLEDVTACEEALGKLLRRSQIRFATGSASLLPTSRPLLKEIASQLKDCPGTVVVEGHTDAQGVREQNIQLSENRAKAVVRVLIGAGIPKARVRAEGFGPDRPLATNETATGRAQNRRIEFRVARTANSGE